MRRIYIICSFLFILSLPLQAGAFIVPEKLTFDLSWIGIHAGTAVLTVEKNEGKFIIRSRADSADFISVFYKVEDTGQSIVDAAGDVFGYPDNYRLKVREGSHRRDKEVVFDKERHKAVFIDHRKKNRKEFDIEGFVYDPLSAFYSVRTMDLKAGVPVSIKMFDSKKVWTLEVEVIRKERVEVPAGTFDTIMIKPKIQSEGIFKRSGDIFIWLTDDEKKVPVRIKTEAPIGHIIGELVSGVF